MNTVNVVDLINQLKGKSEKGECQWQDVTNGHRLYLKSGSVGFSYSFDPMMNGYDYSIKLFDTTEQFAYYHVDLGEDYREDLYQSCEALRLAIENWKTSVINGKIQSLFDELL